MEQLAHRVIGKLLLFKLLFRLKYSFCVHAKIFRILWGQAKSWWKGGGTCCREQTKSHCLPIHMARCTWKREEAMSTLAKPHWGTKIHSAHNLRVVWRCYPIVRHWAVHVHEDFLVLRLDNRVMTRKQEVHELARHKIGTQVRARYGLRATKPVQRMKISQFNPSDKSINMSSVLKSQKRPDVKLLVLV